MPLRCPKPTAWLALCLLGAAACLLPLAATAAEPAAEKPAAHLPARVQAWLQALRETDADLRAGDWKPARLEAQKVLDSMCDGITGGEGVGHYVAVALTYLALAEAGEGRTTDAIWHWHLAQQLFPEAGGFDLTPFGAPGQTLATSRPRLALQALGAGGDEPYRLTDSLEGKTIEPPRPKKRHTPKFPEGMRKSRKEQLVELELVIDIDGVPTMPLVLKHDGDVLFVVAALEAIRTWRYEPARLEGRPVPVYLTLTVNFGLD